MIARRPELADGVEKVCGTQSARNNRIRIVDVLIRSCAFEARLESILLGASLKIPFQQDRPKGDVRPKPDAPPKSAVRWLHETLPHGVERTQQMSSAPLRRVHACRRQRATQDDGAPLDSHSGTELFYL